MGTEPRLVGADKHEVASLPRTWAPWLVALAAAALALSWQALQVNRLYGGQWSGLFFTSLPRPIPEPLRGTTYLHPPWLGYDGMYYRYAAYDPLPPFENAESMDGAQLRYRRILVPWTARLLAFGQDRWTDAAYIGVILLSVAAGVWASSHFFLNSGLSPLWGALFLLLPGTVASTDRMVVDVTLSTLFVITLAFGDRLPRSALWCIGAAAALTRETGLVIVFGLMIARSPWFLTAALPAAAWWACLRAHFTESGEASGAFGFLAYRWFKQLFHPRTFDDPGVQLRMRTLDTLALLGFALALWFAVRWAWRRWNDPASIAALALAASSLGLGGSKILEDPYAFGRAFSPMLCYVLYAAVVRKNAMAATAVLAIAATPLAYSLRAFLSAIR